MPISKQDYKREIENQGYKIMFNPPGDGSCQFSVLAHQLNSIGIYRSPKSLRDEIMRYLEAHPVDNDGFPLTELIPEDEFRGTNTSITWPTKTLLVIK